MTMPSDPDFIYVIYIMTTREKLWAELTDNESERFWWGDTRMDSDFQPGSTHAFVRNGNVDVRGEILEAVPNEKLVFTFEVQSEPQKSEGASTVTYLIEDAGPWLRLTVTHTGFPENSRVREGISGGWPSILSGLKSFLEVGPPPEPSM